MPHNRYRFLCNMNSVHDTTAQSYDDVGLRELRFRFLE